MQPSPSSHEPVTPAAEPTPGIVAPITLVFEHPLHPAQRLVINRVRDLIATHHFELHDIQAGGESIHHIRVGEHVRKIELGTSEQQPAVLIVRFTVNDKQDKDALVWTSSLFFQYVHYHVARIATMNGAPHHMDWEAQQDPQGPARVKRWVESGESMIERLHKR
ncbi:MAG TPA: hypothetical protein VM536_04315 [Chloroflexia bacterium]|nr:hypothetical protein [Chloroflexia bacterium]